MFSIRSCANDEATDFWKKSSAATVFTSPEVVEKLGQVCDWWVAEKGSEPFVLWPVVLDEAGKPTLPPFSYFFGPVWSDTALLRAPSSRFADRLRAYEAFTEFLFDRYGALNFELAPQFLDVRAFSWWNYGDQESPQFVIEPRYTAQLRNLQSRQEEEIIAGLRELRRREIKRVDSEDRYTLHSEVSWTEVVDLYARLFENQGIAVETETSQALERLGNFVGTEWASLTVVKERETGVTVSAVFTLRAKGVSNMVLNLTHPDHRKSGVGTWAVLHSILDAKKFGDDVYDFNGANSPRRGDDKHSYGAEDVLYFRLSLS